MLKQARCPPGYPDCTKEQVHYYHYYYYYCYLVKRRQTLVVFGHMG